MPPSIDFKNLPPPLPPHLMTPSMIMMGMPPAFYPNMGQFSQPPPHFPPMNPQQFTQPPPSSSSPLSQQQQQQQKQQQLSHPQALMSLMSLNPYGNFKKLIPFKSPKL
jgi:hypothetical protein